MLKKAFIGLVLFAVALMVALAYLTARFVDQEAIAKLKEEKWRLEVMRDSIYLVSAVADSLQQVYQERIDEKSVEVAFLKEQVAQLESRREAAQLSVRMLRRREDLQQRLAETFPEMAHSNWGVTEVLHEETGLRLEYLLVPLWFSETFIIDHQNAESYRAQRDTLLKVDDLRVEISVLQDSLLTKEREKAMAFKAGYDEAYARYDALLADHLSLLQKPPRVSLFPEKKGLLLAGVTGAVVGVAVGATVTSVVKK